MQKKKTKAKIWIKYIGNLLTLFAIIFVLKKLLQTDVDYNILFKARNILPIILIIMVQTIINATNVIPWRTLVQAISNKKVPFKSALPVFVKSNLMKYIPGNVFQYIGRNELAVNQNISHVEVAFSTMLDVLLNVVSAGLISCLFLYSFIFDFLSTYLNNYNSILWIVLVFLILIFVIIYLLRKKIVATYQKYAHFFTVKTMKNIGGCLIYYMIVMMLSSLMFSIILHWVLAVNLSLDVSINLFSAYTLAWLVGFITPGAPAGIGIKELVMVAVTGNVVPYSTIALGMILLRILTIIADILSYFLITLFYAERGKK